MNWHDNHMAASFATMIWFTALLQNDPASVGCSTSGIVTRENLKLDGSQSVLSCTEPTISANGRFVAHVSAEAIGQATYPHAPQIYLRDRWGGNTICASVNSQGAHANKGGGEPVVSFDCQRIVFRSYSTNLDPRKTFANVPDAFVHDFATGVTQAVDVSSAGAIAAFGCDVPSISGDGLWVCFSSYSNNLDPNDQSNFDNAFIHEIDTGHTERIDWSYDGTPTDGNTAYPAMSPDGRFTVFASDATKLVPGDTNGSIDIFLFDRVSKVISLNTRGFDGTPENASCNPFGIISADGRFVSFSTVADNIVLGDANGVEDLFVRDLWAQQTTLVSVNTSGRVANGRTLAGDLSADGRYICFASEASDLVANDTNGKLDAFVRDLMIGTTKIVSVTNNGAPARGDTVFVRLAAGGRFVTFMDTAKNLVTPDASPGPDIFVSDWQPPAPTTYCTAKANSQHCVPAIDFQGCPSLSAGSGFVVRATRLINRQSTVFLYSRFGPARQPFAGAALCLNAPIERAGVTQNSGGSATGHDCTGHAAIDFTAWIASGQDPELQLGARVWLQAWSRDPGATEAGDASLTEGLEFTILQ